MDFDKIGNITHYVFDSEEEMLAHMGDETPDCIVEDWREADIGDWTWSDDGRLVQVLRKGPLGLTADGVQKHYIGTIVGTFKVSEDTLMDTDFLKHPNRYTISGKPRDNPYKFHRFTKRKKLTRAEYKFCMNVRNMRKLNNGIITYDDIIQCINLAYPHMTSKRRKQQMATKLIASERIQDMINKDVKDAAARLDINADFVMSHLKRIVLSAEDDKSAIAALKELRVLLDIAPKTPESGRKSMRQLTGGFQHIPIAEIEDAGVRPTLITGESNTPVEYAEVG